MARSLPILDEQTTCKESNSHQPEDEFHNGHTRHLTQNVSLALIPVVRLVIYVPDTACFRTIGEEILVFDTLDVSVTKADLMSSEVPSLRCLDFMREPGPLRQQFDDREPVLASFRHETKPYRSADKVQHSTRHPGQAAGDSSARHCERVLSMAARSDRAFASPFEARTNSSAVIACIAPSSAISCCEVIPGIFWTA